MTEDAEPWQLQYYDPSIHDIIEHAKQFSHCDAASISTFPLCPAFNAKAAKYIEEAIAECQDRQLHISEGNSCPNSMDRFTMQVGGRNILWALPDW